MKHRSHLKFCNDQPNANQSINEQQTNTNLIYVHGSA